MRQWHIVVDHIVIVTQDLKKAAQVVRSDLGLEVRAGGVHEGVGTENMIVPLSRGYLELVTVVDASLTAATPFGRLVAARLADPSAGAPWAAPAPERFSAPDGLSTQRLRRAGVSVELFGADEVTTAGHLPFLVERGADQPPPGALPAGAGERGRVPAGITALTVRTSSRAADRAAQEAAAAVRPGPTAVTFEPPGAAADDAGGVTGLTIGWSDATSTHVDLGAVSRA